MFWSRNNESRILARCYFDNVGSPALFSDGANPPMIPAMRHSFLYRWIDRDCDHLPGIVRGEYPTQRIFASIAWFSSKKGPVPVSYSFGPLHSRISSIRIASTSRFRIYLFAGRIDMDAPTRIFVVLSGEHPTLPMGELKAILDANHIRFKMLDSFYKLVEIEADLGAVKKIAGRGAFIDEVGQEIMHSGVTIPEIDDAVKTSDLRRYINSDESFSIRVHRFGGVSKETSRVRLEGHLGWLIGRLTGARVNLETPRHVFRGLLAGPYLHMGVVEHTRPSDFVGSRRPRKRPAFHPSTMTPKLARSMVNLSGAVDGTIFLDPFCGVGGILLEASLLGCKVVGMDALRRMVRGSRKNLKHFGKDSLGLMRGDARKVPLRNIEAIATDPPYGTGASTLKSNTHRILEDFLPQARSSLANNARLVVASPKETGTPDIAESSGFKIVDSHDVYVHRRLTREILVLEAN